MNTQSMPNLRAGVFATSLAVAAFALASTAAAQTTFAKADVPFAFEDGSRHLPAGKYTLSMLNPRIISVRGEKSSTLAMVQPEDTLKPAAEGKLVFHRYGNRYLLREIWTAGSTTHLECPKSKLEKELQLAGNRSTSSGLEIASIDVLR